MESKNDLANFQPEFAVVFFGFLESVHKEHLRHNIINI